MSFLKKLFNSEADKTGVVFIIEDNKTYASGIKTFLTSHFPQLKSVDIFPVGETCLPELERNPDAVIVDYFLDSRYPDAANGLEIIKQIRRLKPSMNIIVLSSQPDVNVVLESVMQYQCSYVQKDENALNRLEELMGYIQNGVQ